MPEDFSNVNKGSTYSAKGAEAIADTGEEETPMPERYSRHLQSLVRPSTYEAFKAKAKRKGLTVNKAINLAMEEWAKD